MMSAKRCGLASLLLNIKDLPLGFTKLVSFAVSGEFYFTSLLLGFPHRLVGARKPIFRLTSCNELKKGYIINNDHAMSFIQTESKNKKKN